MKNITLKDLIDAHILNPGQVIHPVNRKKEFSGTIQRDGTIEASVNHEKKQFTSLSSAAKALEGISLNGWKYWAVTQEGKVIKLSIFRDQYLQSHS